jgi:hypothetical protein
VKHKAEDLIKASDSIGASECRFNEAESSIAAFRMDEPAALSLHDTCPSRTKLNQLRTSASHKNQHLPHRNEHPDTWPAVC